MAVRLGWCEKEWSEPTIQGTYVTMAATGSEWQCEGCGLVWPKRWYAETCAERQHRPAFTQSYGGRVENGRLIGATTYTRRSLRREPVRRAG